MKIEVNKPQIVLLHNLVLSCLRYLQDKLSMKDLNQPDIKDDVSDYLYEVFILKNFLANNYTDYNHYGELKQDENK